MNNKILAPFIFLFYFSCSAPNKKALDSFVFDYENVLEPSEVDRFDELLKAHEGKTSNEVVLVTVEDYGDNENMLMYSVNFGQENAIGKAGKDNGVIIAFSKANHEARISTGYGAEQVLDDVIAKNIVDSLMVPHFQVGQYAEGLWAGSKAVIDFLEKPENAIK
ncbi:TPM domain-containing protein [Cytophagaceae bacterium ABcell3]|nr:TPM domain-containing protein [Cytophagaceae bacterium ABcell3]